MSDLEFSYFAVGFIDLLGQTKSLEEIGELPTSEEGLGEFIEKVKPSIGRVRGFRKQILNLVEKLTNKDRKLGDFFDRLSEDEKRIVKKYSDAQIRVDFLGDSALLSINLREDQEYSSLIGIFILLQIVEIMMISFLAGEVPIRGGIEIGVCTGLETGGIYGQAVSRAHFLESKIAGWPRIVIGDRLQHYLSTISSEDRKDIHPKELRVIQGWTKRISRRLDRDCDGLIISNYLNKELRTSEGQRTFEECYKLASEFIENQIKIFTSKGDYKLTQRYEHLKTFFIKHGVWPLGS